MADAQVTGSLRSFASLIDDAALRFEQAWGAADPARPPAIEAFLPAEPGARDRAALRLAQIEIERLSAAGHEPRAETYLERFPALAADPEDVFALVFTEAEVRLRRGRSVDPDDYRRRFPGAADRLISRLIHRALPQVPGYEIEGELGRGGMGVVYKARQVKLNRTVALKVVTAPDRQSVTRFLLEAEAVAAVRHPHVIQVFDSGEYADLPYLAMEYLDGGSLHDALKRAPVLEPDRAADLLARIAAGVQAVHEAGTVHRDLKPANVLFDAAGVPKVADFGLAMRGGVELTQTQGRFLGTPAYAAPEQAAGHREFVGPPADVWSLGVVLYECLTGSRPFDGTDALSVLNKVQTETPARPRARNPNVPRDLELICLKCLEKEPRDRYPGAAALADDLNRFRAGKPVTARPLGVLAQGAKWVRRNKVLTALAVVFLLGCAGTTAAALVALRKEAERADAESARAGAESARVDAERGAAESAQKQLVAERERAVETERRARAERDAAVAAATQANDFKRVVELVQGAEREGQAVPPDVQFGTANALSALARSEEARARLEALAARADLAPELKARVELRLADELQGVDDERAAALFAAARRSGKLPPADVVYTDALAAATLPDAINLLYKCIDTDPAHFYARRLLGVYLSMCGRLDEAIRIGEQNRLLVRDHPDVLWPLFLAYAFKGDTDRTRKLLGRLHAYVPEEYRPALELVGEYLPQMNREFRAALAGLPPPIDDLVERLKALKAKGIVARSNQPLSKMLTGWLNRFPPAARTGYDTFWRFVQVQSTPNRSYAEELSGDEVGLAELRAALDRRPEGFMRFMYAFSLMCRATGYVNKYGTAGPHGNRYREMMKMAGDAYLIAADTPALTEVRAVSLDGAVLTYGVAGRPIWAPHPDPEAIEKSAAALRTRLAYPEPIIPARYEIFVKVARNAGDVSSARLLLEQWERIEPRNPQVLALRAEIELQAGAYPAALRAARAVLAKQPASAAMLGVQSECLSRLKRDPDLPPELAPAPRIKQ